jgi:hypothetical protein
LTHSVSGLVSTELIFGEAAMSSVCCFRPAAPPPGPWSGPGAVLVCPGAESSFDRIASVVQAGRRTGFAEASFRFGLRGPGRSVQRCNGAGTIGSAGIVEARLCPLEFSDLGSGLGAGESIRSILLSGSAESDAGLDDFPVEEWWGVHRPPVFARYSPALAACRTGRKIGSLTLLSRRG